MNVIFLIFIIMLFTRCRKSSSGGNMRARYDANAIKALLKIPVVPNPYFPKAERDK